ncbi:hypothetical protein B0H10DRAFT_2055296 [Mycena sp. CBHHK59/15]|nr:hypothetical protein B0H10DRAFT_2055296 [Mycena sp. CBHHK59/15]
MPVFSHGNQEANAVQSESTDNANKDANLTSPDTYNHVASATGTPSSPVREESASDDGSTGAITVVRSPDGSRSRVRVSKRNAIHGMVEGVMRGGTKYQIARTKKLRPMKTDRKEASARFL